MEEGSVNVTGVSPACTWTSTDWLSLFCWMETLGWTVSGRLSSGAGLFSVDWSGSGAGAGVWEGVAEGNASTSSGGSNIPWEGLKEGVVEGD